MGLGRHLSESPGQRFLRLLPALLLLMPGLFLLTPVAHASQDLKPKNTELINPTNDSFVWGEVNVAVLVRSCNCTNTTSLYIDDTFISNGTPEADTYDINGTDYDIYHHLWNSSAFAQGVHTLTVYGKHPGDFDAVTVRNFEPDENLSQYRRNNTIILSPPDRAEISGIVNVTVDVEACNCGGISRLYIDDAFICNGISTRIEGADEAFYHIWDSAAVQNGWHKITVVGKHGQYNDIVLVFVNNTFAPFLEILSPVDDDTLTTREVIVKGRTYGPDTAWFQAGDPGFHDGTMDGVAVCPDGDLVLSNLTAGYGCRGNFTSAIYNTGGDEPELKQVVWNASLPANTSLSVELRSGGRPDLGDSTPWMEVQNGQTGGFPETGKYLQYRAILGTADGRDTPSFRDFLVLFGYHEVRSVEVSTGSSPGWTLADGEANWSARLVLDEGRNVIRARVIDDRDRSRYDIITVNVDTTGPTGELSINGGEAVTDRREVRLAFNVSDRSGMRSMMVCEDRDFSNSIWEDFTPGLDFILSPGDGPKTVFARLNDMQGWNSSILEASIVLDMDPPEGSIMINNGSVFTNRMEVIITMSVSDKGGVTGMMVSNDQLFAGASWVDFQEELGWNLLPGLGWRTVFARFIDLAGHESGPARSAIFLDPEAPAAKVSLNGGAEYTRYRTVNLTVRATDSHQVSSMLVSEDPAFGDALWQPYERQMVWNLSLGDGPKDIYVRVRDFAGNIGQADASSIVLDSTPPESGLNGLPPIAGSPEFNINWSGSDSGSGVVAYDLQFRDGSSSWQYWQLDVNYTNATFIGIDGHSYSFRVRARDRAGNLQTFPETGTGPVLIRLPQEPPLPPAVIITRPGPNATISGMFLVTGSAQHRDGVDFLDIVLVQVDNGTWEPADGTSGWSFWLDTTILDNGPHFIHVKAIDSRNASGQTTLEFQVFNPVRVPETGHGSTPAAGMMMILVAMAVCVVIASRRKWPPAGRYRS